MTWVTECAGKARHAEGILRVVGVVKLEIQASGSDSEFRRDWGKAPDFHTPVLTLCLPAQQPSAQAAHEA